MTDYEKLGDILMKWAMENREYELAYILFTQFGVVLPIKLLYSLPEKKIQTYSEALDDYDHKEMSLDLSNLIKIVKTGKYGKYGNTFGYKNDL